MKKVFNIAFVTLLGLQAGFAQDFTKELVIPPTLEGPEYNLEVAKKQYEFFDGVNTNTFGVNLDYLGPTLIMNAGDEVTLNVTNNIDETTTMHWHGMHVSAADDGGPHTTIDPNTTWSPNFEVLDNATTFWYHPHLHEHTEKHVHNGAAGMIIVRDDKEAALDLPRTYGVDDIPLILQTKAFDENRQLRLAPNVTDSVPVVNGVIKPYFEVPAQMVRYRALNASSGRVFNLGFNDDRSFYQIGSDGGLLEKPVELNRIMLSPGERVEFIVDFSGEEDGTVTLMSYAHELFGDVPGGGVRAGPAEVSNPLDGRPFDFMEFRVKAATSNAVTSIPTTLISREKLVESDADTTRTFFFDAQGPGEPFIINNRLMDMDYVNEVVQLGATEIWELTNRSNTGHPFHIHDVQFYILDRNGQTPPENEQGLKDVVYVGGDEVVRVIARFEDHADDDIPYMYHCHLLQHEDQGMMGQFIVVSDEEALSLKDKMSRLAVYPNPVDDNLIRVKLPSFQSLEKDVSFELVDLSGKKVRFRTTNTCGPTGLHILYLEEQYSGVMILKTNVSGQTYVNRVIVE